MIGQVYYLRGKHWKVVAVYLRGDETWALLDSGGHQWDVTTNFLLLMRKRKVS